MSKIEDLLESELGNMAICVNELHSHVAVLELISDRISGCECSDPGHLCNLWLIDQLRASLECHADILDGVLRNLRKQMLP